MAALLIALLIVIILFGVGFGLHLLWWIAVIALIVWLLGFVFRGSGKAAGPRRRWFHW